MLEETNQDLAPGSAGQMLASQETRHRGMGKNHVLVWTELNTELKGVVRAADAFIERAAIAKGEPDEGPAAMYSAG
jgi:hypothetical protein